jgi:integrase
VKGHIRERSPGHWAIVIDARDAAGKRKRRWHSFKGTKRQAQIECARLISELQHGGYAEPGKITVSKYLDRWLEHVRTQVSPSSHATYSTMLLSYVTPIIGAIRLGKLCPADIAKCYAVALQTGCRMRQGGLSPKSVGLVHRVLGQALKQAVRWQLLASNPAAAVTAPRVERQEMKTLDADSAATLIEAARGEAMFVPILLAIMTGIRRGEIAALRWRSIDLDSGQLAVVASTEQVRRDAREKPPKSGRSRAIALPALVVDELRRHRLAQAEELLRLGVRSTEDTHVCLQADGAPWRPSTMTAAFARLLKASALPRVRLHDLRHTHASHLLAANVHPKIVQERLGHASVAMTLDLYSHVTPGLQEEAAASADAVMRAAMQRRKR